MTDNMDSPESALNMNTTAAGKSLQTAHGSRRKRRELSLRESDKLKNKKDFDEVKNRGKRQTCRYFTLLLLPADSQQSGLAMSAVQCGVICSRRFHKRAVVRNRARRIIWESFRLLKARILPCRIIVIPRRGIYTAGMNEVKTQLETILLRMHHLNPSRI